MKRWLMEPLLHFALLGALIFAVDAVLSAKREEPASATHIAVDAETIAWLRGTFARQWHRAPDESQLRGLIANHLREEVLYREALALGLDRDDAIVRRRMAQKMEFLSQDVSAAVDPGEATMQAFFAQHPQRYAKPDTISFQHLYFSPERRGASLQADVRAALITLGDGADDSQLGDPFLREHEFARADATTIGAAFGAEFATEVAAMPVGAWRGPVASSYGAHLVRISERTPSPPATFASVRDAVLRDVKDERRIAANHDLVEGLKARYRITIDEAAITGGVSPAVPTTVARNADASP